MTTSELRSPPRTAVIGAGISGLTAGKMLDDYGVPYTCFETSDRIGGNWAFGNPNGHSSAYRSLHIDTSKHRLSFKDFPMPEDYPDFPHHTQIKAYLDAYADAFGLLEHIEFGNGVVHAARRPDGGWAIHDQAGETRQLRPARRRQRAPLGPAAAGLPRRVHRRVHPLPPLHRPADAAGPHGQADPGRRPRQQRRRHHRRAVVASRCRTRSPSRPARARGSCRSTLRPAGRQVLHDLPVPAAVVAAQGSRRCSQLMAGSDPTSSTGCRTPNHKFFEAHPTQSVELPLRLGSGDVTPKPNVARLDGDTVHFEDGTSARLRRHRLRDRLQHHLPVLRRRLPQRAGQPDPAVQADVQAGHRRPGVHRASRRPSRRCSRSWSARPGCWRRTPWAATRCPTSARWSGSIDADQQLHPGHCTDRPRHTQQVDYFSTSTTCGPRSCRRARKRAAARRPGQGGRRMRSRTDRRAPPAQ